MFLKLTRFKYNDPIVVNFNRVICFYPFKTTNGPATNIQVGTMDGDGDYISVVESVEVIEQMLIDSTFDDEMYTINPGLILRESD